MENYRNAKAKLFELCDKGVVNFDDEAGRYIAENEHGNGILKVIVNNKHNNIIGLHMIGSYASEIIYGAAMMVETEMRVTDIQKLVFPHPTVCDVIREAMFE